MARIAPCIRALFRENRYGRHILRIFYILRIAACLEWIFVFCTGKGNRKSRVVKGIVFRHEFSEAEGIDDKIGLL